MRPHEIPFTQFLLPNGRQRATSTFVGDLEFEAYKKLSSMGFRMTVEMLSNGIISQAIEDPELGDFDLQLSANNEEVPRALSKLLLRFNPDVATEWRRAMNSTDSCE